MGAEQRVPSVGEFEAMHPELSGETAIEEWEKSQSELRSKIAESRGLSVDELHNQNATYRRNLAGFGTVKDEVEIVTNQTQRI